ncbi:MAG: L-rhamnose mutarotase [Planctomycetes bacterium]|nr:L-rhamnose mutarotase [Planctomycetota bacterium]
MIRKAFVMSVAPGMEAEYERRHRPIWPELEAVLRAHGVRSYAIFLDAPTRQLFAYAEIDSEERWAAIAQTPECRRWWAHMRDLMPSNPDASPVARDLREVFGMDGLPPSGSPEVRKSGSLSLPGSSARSVE